MNGWQRLLKIIREEIGGDAAVRIETRARKEMAGQRITISARPTITSDLVENAAPGRPREAARQLGIHPSTAYRALRGRRIIR